MRNRIAYSQNFIKDSRLVSDLLNKSSITKEDTVYEIGAGQGIITAELLKKSGKVVSFEVDPNLYSKLSQRFQSEKSLELKQGDFLTCFLPTHPYKVFSNIPFNITSEIIKKITDRYSPVDAYLIVQREAAMKFVGRPYDRKNSQVAILLKPWFDTSIVYEFNRNDFFPKPNVDTVLLRIKRREMPLLSYKDKKQYDDFVTYSFNQFKPNIKEGLAGLLGEQAIIKIAKEARFSPKAKPSEIPIEGWLGLFDFYLTRVDRRRQNHIRGAYARQLSHQKNLEKINRTRVDRDWKGFKKRQD